MIVKQWFERRQQVGLLLVALVLFPGAREAAAQTDRPYEVQGFFELGSMSFRASESFDAIFGESTAGLLGGGGQVTLHRGAVSGLFFGVSVERLKKTGERVFLFGEQVFPLGIELRTKITPILVTAGWKFAPAGRIVLYVGGGYGSYKYEEASDFAEGDENVSERFNGYHMLGGAEFDLWRWIGAGAEVRWATVPDALGEGGASAAFEDDNLGGFSFQFKVLVGN